MNIDAYRIIYRVLDAANLWPVWYNATEAQQIAVHDALLDAVRNELASGVSPNPLTSRQSSDP